MVHPMMQDGIWFEKYKVDDAEKLYQERRAKELSGLVVKAVAHSNQSADQSVEKPTSALAGQIARARQNIQNTLNSGVGLGIGVTVDSPDLAARLEAVERENAELRQVTADLQSAICKLTTRLNALETGSPAAKPVKATDKQEAPAVKAEEDEDEDSDVDMFGDDDDDDDEGETFDEMQARKQRETEEANKSKKIIKGKSTILLDVKPWDDETDLAEMEKKVRSIEADGLLWRASKLVPVAYGIQKLQICCNVEDDKVGTDFLEEEITKFEDLVQSVDIAAFNKI